jgi:hypothetical protein
MSNQTEELLLAGMEHFTADVTVPSGLAVRAVRNRRRRRVAAAAAGAGTAVAAAVTAVAVVAATSPAPGSAVRAQTTAYVLSRTEAALAAASGQNVIQYLRETASGKLAVEAGDLPAGTYGYWAYDQQARWVTYTAGGRPASVTEAQLKGTQYITTVVSYRNGTWWRQSVTVPSTPASQCGVKSTALSCLPGTSLTGPALTGTGAANWTGLIRAMLRGGGYTVTGPEQVDGVQALKLTPRQPQGLPETVFWVNSSTYLPVRDLTTAGPQAALQVDFRWLRPTQANLADVSVVIPAGFTQVAPPKQGAPGR